ncbi:prefoldin subunit alpha [Candidatus Micrarchaeota archaeon]|nr:prefoldin subunit alpha [Candidatus Micrarchaeota archaeon]
MSEDELKQIYLDLQTHQARLNEMQQQAEMLANALMEVQRTEEAVTHLQDGASSSLLPLGSGVHARIKVEDGERVLMNVGAGVIVEKTREEALPLLAERKNKLDEASQRIQNDMQGVIATLSELEMRGRALAANLKQ